MTRARIATALVLAVAAILAASYGSSGNTSSETATIMKLRRGCLPPAFNLFGPRRPLPKELSTPLQAKILSSFAIFRRPELPSDGPPGVSKAAGRLARELYTKYELSSYYPAYVRQLTRLPDGERYFVIPAYGRPEAVPPARCFRAGIRRKLVEQEHRRLVEPVDCIIEVGGGENASPPGCEPFAAIDEAGRVFQPDLYKKPIVELVPDGVASVRITYRETPPIVVPVTENAFSFTPPPPPPRVEAELKRLEAELKQLKPVVVAKHITKAQRRRITQRLPITLQWDKTVDETEPTKIEWLDSIGGLVRTLNPPTAESSSTTSVGSLRAPIEDTTTLTRSPAEPARRLGSFQHG